MSEHKHKAQRSQRHSVSNPQKANRQLHRTIHGVDPQVGSGIFHACSMCSHTREEAHEGQADGAGCMPQGACCWRAISLLLPGCTQGTQAAHRAGVPAAFRYRFAAASGDSPGRTGREPATPLPDGRGDTLAAAEADKTASFLKLTNTLPGTMGLERRGSCCLAAAACSWARRWRRRCKARFERPGVPDGSFGAGAWAAGLESSPRAETRAGKRVVRSRSLSQLSSRLRAPFLASASGRGAHYGCLEHRAASERARAA